MPGNGNPIATGTGRHAQEVATGRGGAIVTGTGKHSKVERKGACKLTTRTAAGALAIGLSTCAVKHS